jgi:hypothetical protein
MQTSCVSTVHAIQKYRSHSNVSNPFTVCVEYFRGFELLGAGLPDFYRNKIPKQGKMYQISTKYNKWPQNRPNVHYMYTPNILTLKDSPKCTQIQIFGLKINHLATLTLWLLFLYVFRTLPRINCSVNFDSPVSDLNKIWIIREGKRRT